MCNNKEKNILYILTILELIEKIDIYIQGFSKSKEFYNAKDQLYFNATVSLLLAIGEEVKKIDNSLKTNKEIPWKHIGDMRNILAHNYRGIDDEIVWEVSKDGLKPLKNELIKIIVVNFKDSSLLKQSLDLEFYRHLVYLKKEMKND